MTRRRLSVLLTAAIAAAAVGGFICSRTYKAAPDGGATKAEDVPLALTAAKATTPARVLSEKEKMLVGKWKFENLHPGLFAPGYQATYEFAPDGTFTFSYSSVYVKHWSRRGKFHITGDTIVKESEDGYTSVNMIEYLDDSRFVVSAQNGRDCEVQEWSRIRCE